MNKRTQSVVCDDLGMTDYVIYADNRFENLEMKQKEKADLLEGIISSNLFTQCKIIWIVIFIISMWIEIQKMHRITKDIHC